MKDFDGGRAAIPSPAPISGNQASSMPSKQSHELLDQLQTLVDRVKTMGDGDKQSLVDHVKHIAKSMQQRVAKLGGIANPRGAREAQNDGTRLSRPDGRPSLSPSLDGYRPDSDVVAPISVRPNAMELLWVCGDCGQHYPRQMEPPEACSACGAPKQNFYAPIED